MRRPTSHECQARGFTHTTLAKGATPPVRANSFRQASFAEVGAAEDAEHLQLTVAAYEDYRRGILPAGNGARDLIRAFHTADRILAAHDPGAVTVVDDRRVERVLRAKAKDPAYRRRKLLLVLRSQQSPVSKTCRHRARRTAADRDVRLRTLPTGHPPPRAPPSVGRTCRIHPNRLPREPKTVHTRKVPSPSHFRPRRPHPCRDRRRHRGAPR